jgi:phosphoribosyl-ATP pyrophosphohydrolase/phosphoribosyl-AMP cyclohydrolase
MMEIQYDDRGLVPAVAQDATTGEILMVAWMNAEALALTRETGFAHFYSRSRETLWQKGETSGNTLAVRQLRADCDGDTLLLLADPAGPACHTGARSCFFRPLDAAEDQGPGGAAAAILDRLGAVLRARRDQSTPDRSYTRSLLDGGFPKILAKIAEEHGELAEVLPDGARATVVHETADLLFHVLVGLVARDINPREVWRELERRFGTSGHEEKASRSRDSE